MISMTKVYGTQCLEASILSCFQGEQGRSSMAMAEVLDEIASAEGEKCMGCAELRSIQHPDLV